MKILHTEGSTGWGGQEIRILKEMEEFRKRGHEMFLAVERGAQLGVRARACGFFVLETSFKKKAFLATLPRLIRFLRLNKIDVVNTHSSSDAWIGGVAARVSGVKVIRTRHLSIPIKGRINSWLLYKKLADFVVTTSSGIIPMICRQAKVLPDRCRCIPTGVDLDAIAFPKGKEKEFRNKLLIPDDGILIGTACFVRSWKGIYDFLEAAALLQEHRNLHWIVVGGGYVEQYKEAAHQKGLGQIVHFVGHLENPYPAIASFDIFMLLSTANEGISQASLQAAYLKKPLVMTTVGGLPEVCLEGETGFLVPPHSPEQVAKTVLFLTKDEQLRRKLGENGHDLVKGKFTLNQTVMAMEEIFISL